jgi:hypothetical protein
MYKYIVGVWNIAEDDNEVVTANTLDLPKGESMNMEVQILLNSGQEASLVGTTLSFRLVDYNMSPLYSTSTTQGDRLGRANFDINLPAYIAPGTYSWDMWIESGGRRYQVKPLAAFRLNDTSRTFAN